jgi:hypothetical protein
MSSGIRAVVWKGRIAASAMVLVLLQAMALALSAQPARAATCATAVHDSFGAVAAITFDWAPECSDGRAQISGTLQDATCDSREAIARVVVYDRRPDGTYTVIDDQSPIKASNGCGTSSNFTRGLNSPGSIGWRLYVMTWACNSGSCSSISSKTYFG